MRREVICCDFCEGETTTDFCHVFDGQTVDVCAACESQITVIAILDFYQRRKAKFEASQHEPKPLEFRERGHAGNWSRE